MLALLLSFNASSQIVDLSKKEYKNGQLNGVCIKYAPQLSPTSPLQIISITQYKDNVMHGKSIEYYTLTGSKKRELEYYDGLKHGKEKYWTINGVLIFYKKYQLKSNSFFNINISSWDKRLQKEKEIINNFLIKK